MSTFTISATPKVLERVYYAIERAQAKPDMSAQAINSEIENRFGAPLSTQIWTTLNAARRDNALARIKTRAFDFARHGRVARMGKGKRQRQPIEPQPERRDTKGRRPADVLQRVKLDVRKHARYLVAIVRDGKREYLSCRTRKQADRLLRRYVSDGVALTDVVIYRAEDLAIRFSSMT